MEYPLIFAILAVAELASIAAIFASDDIKHSVLALGAAFFVNSLMFVLLEQPELALVQLFILICGISTYIFVGISSEGSQNFRQTNYPLLVLLSAAVFAIFFCRVAGLQFTQMQQGQSVYDAIVAYMAADIGFLWTIILKVFGVAFEAIVIFKWIRAIK